MKKIEGVAVVLIVLWVLTLFASPILTIAAARIYSIEEYINIQWTHKALIAARSIVSVLVYLGVAIWLFIQAKRDKASPWVWGLFGLIFGISAAILYFLMQFIEEMKMKRTAE